MKHLSDYCFEEVTHETVDKLFGKYCGKVFLPTRIKYEDGVYLIHSGNEISEGVSKTYPSKLSVKKIINNLKSKDEVIPNSLQDLEGKVNSLDDNAIENLLSFYLTQDDFSEHLLDNIRNAFLSCGYDLGAHWTANAKGRRVENLQFEPLYPKEPSFKIGDYLYHITTRTSFKKIQRDGLIPVNRCKIEKFSYTGRCYFFVDDDEDKMKEYIKKSMNVDNSNNDSLGCIILKIDRTKIPNVKFFTDPNMPVKAVFSYENISPHLIVSTKEV